MLYFVELNEKKYEVEVSDNTVAILNETMRDTMHETIHEAKKNDTEAMNIINKPLLNEDGLKKNLIKAEMPGIILTINIKKGDDVQEGDVILVYESMKMENEVVAHKCGTIRELFVSTGSRVALGDNLFILE